MPCNNLNNENINRVPNYEQRANDKLQNQENVSRWKVMSKRNTTDLILKIGAIVAAVLISCAVAIVGTPFVFSIGAGIAWTLPVALGTMFGGMGGVAASWVVATLMDFSRYSDPHVAWETSVGIKQSNFTQMENDYNLNALTRYGFITKEVGKEIKDLKKEKAKIVKYLDDNGSQYSKMTNYILHQPTPLKSDDTLKKYQDFIEKYQQQESALKNIENKWQEMRDKKVAPQLPYPEPT